MLQRLLWALSVFSTKDIAAKEQKNGREREKTNWRQRRRRREVVAARESVTEYVTLPHSDVTLSAKKMMVETGFYFIAAKYS